MNKILCFCINILLLYGLIVLSACTPKDPSIYDLKSPCAANDDTIIENGPCVRRKPSENYIT